MNPLAPLTVAVPLAGAATLLVLNLVLRRWATRAIALAFALGEIGLSAALLHAANQGTVVYWFGGWTPHRSVALGISFTVDPLGAGAAVLSGVVVAAAIFTTSKGFEEAGGLLHALLLTLLAAMAGFSLTGDLFNLFVFFELMAVSAFGVAAYRTESAAALRGALNLGITNSIGAFLVLIGIALLYARTGALNLAQISRNITASGHADGLVVVAFATIVVGLLVKAAIVPFHFWLVDAASTAPLPATIVLAGALDMLGVYAVARVCWTVFATPLDAHLAPVRAVLISLGVVTALVAAALALASAAPGRRLAFVLVSHTGLLVIAVGTLTRLGLAGAAVYAVADGAAKAAVFGGLALLAAGREGAGRAFRGGVAVVALGGLALAGLPPFGTALAKGAINDAASAVGFGWVAPVIVIVSAATGGAVLAIAASAWLQAEARPNRSNRDRGMQTLIGSASLLAISALAGLGLSRWASNAAARVTDVTGYQRLVLLHLPQRIARAAPLRLSFGGIVLDLLTVAGAVAVAGAMSSTRTTVPGSLAALARRVQRVLQPFQSASIADSAAWLTVGAATVTLLFAMGLR